MYLTYITLAALLLSNGVYATESGKEFLSPSLDTQIVKQEIRKVDQIINDLEKTQLSLLQSNYKNEKKDLQKLQQEINQNPKIDAQSKISQIKEKYDFWTEAFYQ